MSSPEEIRSQSGMHAADAADDDIVVVDEEAAVKEPGRGPWVPDRESSSAPAADVEPGQAGPTAGGGPGGMSPAAADRGPRTGPSAPRDDRRWREIQGMFVDDPRDSVQRASDLIDTAIEEFLAEIRQRQAALASSWQNRDADTEMLRIALKDYRALWAVVRDMPAVGATGGAAAASAGVGGSSFGAGPGGPAGQHEPERGRTPA
jgi:hypothetical protein